MSAASGANLPPVNDGQRDETRAVLGQHYASGALTSDQYSDRMGTAATAGSVGELRELFSDLPHPYPISLGGQPAPGRPQPQAGPYGPPPQSYGPPPGYGQPAYGRPTMPPPGMGGFVQPAPGAPFGIDARTGVPFSDKQKLVAGLLQIFVGGFGVGRFYTGHTGIAIAQLLTCGGCGIWSLVDGIMMLTGSVTDSDGRPLRD